MTGLISYSSAPWFKWHTMVEHEAVVAPPRFGVRLTYRRGKDDEDMTDAAENNSQGSYQDSLTKLPQLANAAIRFNLQEEMKKLRGVSTWAQPTGRSSATLVKHEDLRVVLTLMKKGSRIAQHRAEGAISIQAVQGRVRLYVGGKEICELASGDVLALQAGLEHDVEALEESAFLLTIASSRPSQAER